MRRPWPGTAPLWLIVRCVRWLSASAARPQPRSSARPAPGRPARLCSAGQTAVGAPGRGVRPGVDCAVRVDGHRRLADLAQRARPRPTGAARSTARPQRGLADVLLHRPRPAGSTRRDRRARRRADGRDHHRGPHRPAGIRPAGAVSGLEPLRYRPDGRGAWSTGRQDRVPARLQQWRRGASPARSGSRSR